LPKISEFDLLNLTSPADPKWAEMGMEYAIVYKKMGSSFVFIQQ
jgi:hypothetical protein